MSVIKVKDNNKFIDIATIQGPIGPQGEQGTQGPQGESISVIQATDESNAISLSQQNPNNIYYWSD